MSYNSDFERAFMERSLELVRAYKGPYDATLLLNCLLCLLVVPKESCIKVIPLDPIDDLNRWGISHRSIKAFGAKRGEGDNPKTLRGQFGIFEMSSRISGSVLSQREAPSRAFISRIKAVSGPAFPLRNFEIL